MKKTLFILLLLVAANSKAQDEYVYGITTKAGDRYFSKADPVSGIVDNISSLPYMASLDGLSVIDPIRNIYYFIDGNTQKIIGADIVTGNIISDPVLSNTNGNRLYGMNFNCHDSMIYGIVQKFPGTFYIARVDPVSGIVSNISAPFSASVSGQGTIDPYHNIYYFIEHNSGRYRGYDLSTGVLVSDPLITGAFCYNIESFIYNCADSGLYGLGRNTSITDFYLAKIDPASGAVSYISTMPVSTGLSSTGMSIDSKNRVYYFISDQHLIQVDLVSGNVLNSPLLTNSNGDVFCNIKYNNKCCERDEITMEIAEIEMPNIFSPNNDNSNDIFRPLQAGNITETSLSIYDRWGELFYRTEDPVKGWNGKIKGNDAPDGTYYWLMDYTNPTKEKKNKRGFFLLLR